jgi:OmpA-OmpF porin, OOP family
MSTCEERNVTQIKWPDIGVVILFVSLGVVPAAAQADADTGAYLGAGFGKASATDYCTGNSTGLVSINCDESDSSFKVFGGYRFTRHLAIEAAYVDLGTLSATGSFAGNAFSNNTEITGVTLQAVGIATLGDRFSLMGRIGALFWDMNTSSTVGPFHRSTGDDGVDLALGVGAQFTITPHFGIRADLDYYPELGNSNTGEETVRAVTFGIVFLF